MSYQKLFNIMEQYDVDESGQLDFGEFLKMYWCLPPLPPPPISCLLLRRLLLPKCVGYC